jgi:hypothetical protein
MVTTQTKESTMDIKDFDPRFEQRLNLDNSLTQDLVSTNQDIPEKLQSKLVDYSISAFFGGAFSQTISASSFPKLDQTRSYYIINAYRD